MQRRTASEAYYSKIRDFEILPKDVEADLLDKASRGDIEARDGIVRGNLRLVMSQASRIYHGMGLRSKSAKFDVIDLVSEGNLGLFDAIRVYDPGYGVSFTTVAVPCRKEERSRQEVT